MRVTLLYIQNTIRKTKRQIYELLSPREEQTEEKTSTDNEQSYSSISVINQSFESTASMIIRINTDINIKLQQKE